MKIIQIRSIFGKISSDHDNLFTYKVGETIEVFDFNDNIWAECSTGIHLFISREMAVMD